MITGHFRSYGYEDEGKMILARSTRREEKDFRLDCDKCSFFRLYHIKCEESNRVFAISYCQATKKVLHFQSFFLLYWGYIKNVIMICVYKNRRGIYYTICRCSSHMTNMQIVGSIMCSLSPVSEKKCLHSPSHLCASKRGHVCLFMLNTMRIGRKSNFITNRMIKMACKNTHFPAE